jgi:protein-tyrosine-phosphatase
VKPHPDHITQRAIDEADLIVVFEAKHKDHLLQHFEVSPQNIINWSIEDPIKPTVHPKEAFTQIKERIKQLNSRS